MDISTGQHKIKSMSRRKVKLPTGSSDWYAHWWRQSRIADVDGKGKTKPKADAKFWFEHFWEPRELAIWIYELVRRLPNTKIATGKLSGGDKAILRVMPPYLKLPVQQKAALVFIIARVLDSKLIRDEESALYESSTRSHLPAWQQGQPQKLTDWRQVEVLDKDEAGQTNDEKNDRWQIRSQAREHAMRFLPLILSVWKLASMSSLQNILIPPLKDTEEHQLSGAVISDADLEAALSRAK